MDHIIIMSGLGLWSMNEKSGAPSFYNTIKGYIRNGWNTHLIHISNSKKGSIPGLDYQIINDPFENKVFIRGVGFFTKYLRHAILTKRLAEKTSDVLKEIPPSDRVVIYAYEIEAVSAAKKVATQYHLPLVTRFQGTILSDERRILFKRMRLALHYKALSTKADLIIMTNDGTQGDRILKKLGNTSKLLFLLNGLDKPQLVNREEVLTDISEERKILLTVSRLVNWKRLDRAINAMTEVIKKHPESLLVIVGDGDERSKLEELVRDLGLKDYVRFEGAQPHEKVDAYMQRSDIFLSLYDLSNMGNPLFEAMMNGMPIITTDVGDTSSIVENGINGILLDHKSLSKHDIAEKITYLLENKELSTRLGINAKNYANENFYSWRERIDRETIEVSKLLS